MHHHFYLLMLSLTGPSSSSLFGGTCNLHSNLFSCLLICRLINQCFACIGSKINGTKSWKRFSETFSRLILISRPLMHACRSPLRWATMMMEMHKKYLLNCLICIKPCVQKTIPAKISAFFMFSISFSSLRFVIYHLQRGHTAVRKLLPAFRGFSFTFDNLLCRKSEREILFLMVL